MQQQIIHIHPHAPPKPVPGAPCNGCGVCCLAEPCPLGILLSRRRRGACVALRWDDGAGLYRCGALGDPVSVLGPRHAWAAAVLRWLARRWIGVGIGCDASLQVTGLPEEQGKGRTGSGR
ncbi:MAG TPA: hypothetical protein PKC60_16220 [Hydrogenophaga sp.]|nr:hypothetical protein [Hydrogenophaga sp.]HMP10987.1 hypothetical protein [Hydrogenophaga sp.]